MDDDFEEAHRRLAEFTANRKPTPPPRKRLPTKASRPRTTQQLVDRTVKEVVRQAFSQRWWDHGRTEPPSQDSRPVKGSAQVPDMGRSTPNVH